MLHLDIIRGYFLSLRISVDFEKNIYYHLFVNFVKGGGL